MENSYIFQTYQRVPERVIKAIGQDIKRNMFLRLRHMGQDALLQLGLDFDMAIDQVASEHSPCVDGYRLTDKQVGEIGDLIKMGKNIGAIKEFRFATGEGLREAKAFIDKFTQGRSSEEAFILFTNTFAG